jgi:hypothetical protein
VRAIVVPCLDYVSAACVCVCLFVCAFWSLVVGRVWQVMYRIFVIGSRQAPSKLIIKDKSLFFVNTDSVTLFLFLCRFILLDDQTALSM